MPRGIGILVGLLVVLLAAIGGWSWYEYETSKAARSASSDAARRATAVGAGGRVDAPRGPTADPRRDPGSTDPSRPENRYEAGEVLVVNPPANFESVIGQLGFSVLELVRLRQLAIDVYRLRVPAGMSVPEAQRILNGRFPGLVDANHRFDLSAEESAESRARAAIGWKKVPPNCGAGVRLGMIDAAVDVSHPALAGQKVEYRSFHKADRKPGPAEHGTAIAAMLVGRPGDKGWGGLLPGAELKAANMFEVNEEGAVVGNAIALLKGVEWLAEEKVHVINLSVAGADNKAVRLAIDRAQKKGLVAVAAAGNWGRADQPAYPAAYKDVLAVTAIAENKTIYRNANRGEYIAFAAPGVQMWTAVPGGGRVQSGTSFATPYISVLIAIEVARGRGTNPDALRETLRRAVVDLGTPGKDEVFGFGLVNLEPACAI